MSEKLREDAELERDAILFSLLHHYGPSAVAKVLGSLEESKQAVLAIRKLAPARATRLALQGADHV